MWTYSADSARGRWWFVAGAVLVVLGSVRCQTAAPVTQVAVMSTPPPGGAPKRVMPLGDSLTHGYNIPGGYRSDLWSLITADGRSVDFVGSLDDGPASLPDREHEGHPGWRIDDLSSEVVRWLTAAQPDIVLLMIGTNDIVQDYDRAAAPDRLSALIDRVTDTQPRTQVVVASIPRLGWPPAADWVRAYNVAIPSIIDAKVADGKRVSYADVHSAITAGDLDADLVHLNASGDSKVAAVWYAAIRPILGGDASGDLGTHDAPVTAVGLAVQKPRVRWPAY